ncbi:MAG: DNA primase family protein [Fusobacteriaceae bacterium]
MDRYSQEEQLEMEKENRMEDLGIYKDDKGKYGINHNQFVETFLAENKLKFLGNEYMIYENNYWKHLSSRNLGAKFKAMIKSINKSIYQPAHHRLIIDTLKYEPDEIETINAYSYKINFKNGVFNFKTRKMEEHDIENCFDYINDYELNIEEELETPAFDSLMDTIFQGNKDLIEYMVFLSGYLISNTKTKQKFWICNGGGNNGKSTYLNILEKLIGEDFVLATPISKIGSCKFALGGASGKKMIKASENQNRSTKIDTEVIKNLTGGDRIEVEQKFKESKTLKLSIDLIFSANSILKFNDDTDGFKRRLEVIPFNAKITNPDPTISEKLDNELPAIMNKVIRAFIKGTEENIPICKEIIEETENYVKKAMQVNVGESIYDFLDKYVVPELDSRESKLDIYEYFQKNGKNAFAISREQFWKGFYNWVELEKINIQEIRNVKRSIKGIKLVKDVEDMSMDIFMSTNESSLMMMNR